jgi:hypothetical protein
VGTYVHTLRSLITEVALDSYPDEDNAGRLAHAWVFVQADCRCTLSFLKNMGTQALGRDPLEVLVSVELTQS